MGTVEKERKMGIMAFVGDLGAGKTLSMTWAGAKKYAEWLKNNEKKRIFSNYTLSLPHKFIDSVEDMDKIRDGIFLADELWKWLDARETARKRNKIVNNLLLVSRKRRYHVYYTTQSMRQTDVRLRNITNYVAVPQLSPDNKRCIVYIYDYRTGSFLRQRRFFTEGIFDMYDTEEEVGDI